MRLRPISCLAAVAVLASCSGPEQDASRPAGTVQVRDAVCHPSPPGRRMALCFMTLTASRADSLVSASSPLAGRVALQDAPFENGMMVIQPGAPTLPLPAGRPVALAPGGQTLALQGLRDPLEAGQRATLVLTFGAAPPVDVVARVEAPPEVEP